MESLEAALRFGADAVYLGAERFGMRTSPKNFTQDQLAQATGKAHAQNVRVYLTCNTLMENRDIAALPDFFRMAQVSGVDAVILTDLGALAIARSVAPDLEVHISTQEGVTNWRAAQMLYEMGAKRIVLARELSLEAIREIRSRISTDAELECFVHGSMCVSFSGRCLLSSYFARRDANRGDCAQPCRWKYALMELTRPGEYLPVEEDETGTFLLSAKDMCMIEHIPALVQAGISSLKIEGRAKSAYYTAVVTNAYRCALDNCAPDSNGTCTMPEWVVAEMDRVSHRAYCTGYYFSHPRDAGNIHDSAGYIRGWQVAAFVQKSMAGRLFVTQRNRFFEGEQLEVLEPGKPPEVITVQDLRNEKGEPITCAPHPMMQASFACLQCVSPGALLRRRNVVENQ